MRSHVVQLGSSVTLVLRWLLLPSLASASQGSQAHVLNEIFRIVGTTAKDYVEFGYNTNLLCAGSGANTCRLHQQGWKGLLLDGGHENTSINLHREMISSANIVHLFRKYRVRLEVDYVSEDMDSSECAAADTVPLDPSLLVSRT